MTRIRYTKVDGLLVSNPFLIETEFASIVIYPETLQFDIKTRVGDMVLVSGEADSLADLKRTARETALAFGGKLDKEIKKQSKISLVDYE